MWQHTSVGKGAFLPEERELVFDIDLTDYDAMRTCCKDATVCTRCWAYMAAAGAFCVVDGMRTALRRRAALLLLLL